MALALVRRNRSTASLILAVLVAVVATALIYAAVEYWHGRSAEAPPPEFPSISMPDGASPKSWDDVATRIGLAVAAREQRVQGNKDDWGVHAALASAYLDRAQLAGDYADFGRAQSEIDKSFAVAPDGVGPFVLQAVLAFTLHRLDSAERALAPTDHFAIPQHGRDLAEKIGLRGDIAFYRGQYAQALQFYRQAEGEHPSLGSAFRMRTYYDLTGNEAEAAHYFRILNDFPTSPQASSFVSRTRGIYDLRRGRYDLANRSFDRAALLFPGDWRIEAQRAQMDALEGRLDAARTKFTQIAEDRGSPEAMDALASIARYQGDVDAAQSWSARAGAIWNERLRDFPDAAYAHALDHELAFGTPQRALQLARASWRSRPYGQSAIGLTWALIATGNFDEAKRVIEAALASPWNDAETHVAAARVYALTGDADGAQEQRAAALALNPHAFDANSVLIWFGH